MALIFAAALTSVFSDFDAAQAYGRAVDPARHRRADPRRIEINAAPDGAMGLCPRLRRRTRLPAWLALGD